MAGAEELSLCQFPLLDPDLALAIILFTRSRLAGLKIAGFFLQVSTNKEEEAAGRIIKRLEKNFPGLELELSGGGNAHTPAFWVVRMALMDQYPPQVAGVIRMPFNRVPGFIAWG